MRGKPNSGIQDILFVESGIGNFFVESGILGVEIRNIAQGIRNSASDWNPQSKLHWQRIQNPLPGIRNSQRGIKNQRLSYITLHGHTAEIMAGLEKRSAAEYVCLSRFTILTSPIIHLVYPPKFCITIVFNFSWVLQSSQDNAKFLEVKEGYYGKCENGDAWIARGLDIAWNIVPSVWYNFLNWR